VGDTIVVPNPESAGSKDHQVREMFSRIAPTYDLLNRLLSFGIDQRWRRYAIRRLAYESPAQVLDLCGGTGDFGTELLKARPDDTVHNADFSMPMLERASKRLTEFGPRHGVLCGDALGLPFEDGQFDIGLCGFGVRNWSNLERGLHEVRRVLRSSGEFAILDFLKVEQGFSDRLGRVYVNHILPTVGSLISRDRQAYRYLARSMDAFCSAEEFRGVVRENGFEISEEKRFFMGMCWFFLLKKTS